VYTAPTIAMSQFSPKVAPSPGTMPVWGEVFERAQAP
jgi:hypothetical protein